MSTEYKAEVRLDISARRESNEVRGCQISVLNERGSNPIRWDRIKIYFNEAERTKKNGKHQRHSY